MEGLAWRSEAACRAAWPPTRSIDVDGWRLGVGGGASRRITCATPLSAEARCNADTLARIDHRFDAVGQPTLLRVPALLHGADVALDAAGFSPPEAPTHTLAMRLSHHAGSPDVAIEAAQDARWLAARHRLSLAIDGVAQDYAAPLARITVPTAFAAVERDGAIVALGYAALSHDVAVLEAIAVDPLYRRHGLASAIVAALLGWAQRAGAHHAALQVMAANHAALALYRRAGFDMPLYDYHYRRRDR